MTRKTALACLIMVPGLALAACGNDSSDGGTTEQTEHAGQAEQTEHAGQAEHAEQSMEGHVMEGHSMDGGSAPAGIKDAVDPAYPVGTAVIVQADHMEGMKGATATVTGAYSTATYSVSYTPTDGGARVTGHRWVVHEELANPGAAPLAAGAEVTLNADHMPGMKGAQATIDSVTTEPVYMVDINADGMTMKNHKWVTESELRPAQEPAQ